MTSNTISYFAIQFTETVEVMYHDHDDYPGTFKRGEWLGQSDPKNSTPNKRSIKIFKQRHTAENALACHNYHVWYDGINKAGKPKIVELVLTFPQI